MNTLGSVVFKNEFVSSFEGDETGSIIPRQTPGKAWSTAVPTPVSNPSLLAWSEELGKELSISRPSAKEDIDILAGNLVTPSMQPYAACYAGHQFGHFAGQLGDGRAITLGEMKGPDGRSWELQLKGAGPTAYSRRADGRAVLRSSLREYLMSEAMHYLGVPTTRALSLVGTGDKVLRDMFYDGNQEYEPGAIVMRVAPTFLRFGNFEMFSARKELDQLQKLVDWTIDRYYPHIRGANRIVEWYREVVERTAKMVVEWLRVGFVHGVMNTDNMSILGLTIDYGPYSFLDDYEPNFTPNTTDLPGRRYAFARQAPVAKWNLACLAGAIAPLLTDTTELSAALDAYDDIYWKNYYEMMAGKLGLTEQAPGDVDLITRFVKMLSSIRPDMTIFFRLLMDLPGHSMDQQQVAAHFKQSLYDDLDKPQSDMLTDLVKDYQERLARNTCSREAAIKLMGRSNPYFVPRNYLLHQAIEALQKGDSKPFEKLQDAIKEPYSDRYPEFFQLRPGWATQQAGCSMLSCSS